jgi:hypothetical protein
LTDDKSDELKKLKRRNPRDIIGYPVGCALAFASEAKFEIEAKILLRLEAKKKPGFT